MNQIYLLFINHFLTNNLFQILYIFINFHTQIYQIQIFRHSWLDNINCKTCLQMGKKQKKINAPEQLKEPNALGIRKQFNHIIQRKKKRSNNLIQMKPLKQRQKYFQIPQFCPSGYTKQQFDLYRQQAIRIQDIHIDDLRQILQINKQFYGTINKAELIHKCAEGYALGKVPICPNCYEMTPIYDKNISRYYCPGYKDGETFVKCQVYYQKEDLPRIQNWDNNFQKRQQKRMQRIQAKLKKEKQYQISYKINKKQKINQERQQSGANKEQIQQNIPATQIKASIKDQQMIQLPIKAQ